MIKKILIQSLIFVFLINNTALSDQKIFFINLDFILNNSKEGKIILKDLKNINDENFSKISSLENEIKKENNEIKKIKNIISKEELNNRALKLDKKILDFNKLRKNSQVNFQKIREDKIKNFFNRVNPIIQNYMDNNSIDIVLDQKNVFIGRSDYDISDEIIKLIDK